MSGISLATFRRVYKKVKRKMRYLAHKEHIRRQRLFGHLVQQRVILALAELHQLLSKPLLIFTASLKDLKLPRFAASLYFCFCAFVSFYHCFAIILTTSVTRNPGYFS